MFLLNTEKRREAVKAKIQDIYDESKQNYGAPKITRELRKSGEIISERTVGKYMKQMGIKAQWVKPWTITTKDSDFSSELKNILDEQFHPERPNAAWCSDITYIWTIDGFVYLTSIMDLYSRKIIAWTLSKTLEVSCVIETIKKAKARRNIDKPLILHSDRGNWCSDITYIWTIDGFVYLTSIMDLYSRKIIAWTLSKTLEVSCVIETIKKAKARRNIDKPLILHSDRGNQYVSKEYKRVTATMQCSYSKKGI